MAHCNLVAPLAFAAWNLSLLIWDMKGLANRLHLIYQQSCGSDLSRSLC